MAKNKDAQQHKARVLTPTALHKYGAFENVTPPDEAFDPDKAWTHLYRFWMVGSKWQNYRGFLRLERSPAENGFELKVNQTILLQHHAAVHETNARILCDADTLATPLSWDIESSVTDLSTQEEVKDSRIEKSVTVRDGSMEITTNDRTFTRPLPSVYTSNWSILEALHRLSGPDVPSIEFALLDDLEKIKERHSLSFKEETVISFNEKEIPVYCCKHLGNGMLPYEYYVDMQRRLLLVISGIRAYIFDPHVMETHEENIARLVKKGQQ